MTLELREMVFIATALLTTLPALLVVFSRNILYSAFALFFTFLGTSGLYFFLGAEFLAITQVVVYIGGVSVILLFAILLTRDIDEIKKTNTMSLGRAVPGGVAVLAISAVFIYAIGETKWAASGDETGVPALTVKPLGDLLLNKYLFAFEVVSVLLLAVLIGSLVIARRSVK